MGRIASRADIEEEQAPVDRSGIPVELMDAAGDAEKRVTSLELFFDLVFVFAITQVTGFVSADPTWTRLFEGLAVLAVLWFAWTGYAWLGNTADAEEGVVRVTLLGAMAAMLIASLAVPHAFGSDGEIFGLAYACVRLFHVGTYALVARNQHDTDLAGAVARLASTILPRVRSVLARRPVMSSSRRDRRANCKGGADRGRP